MALHSLISLRVHLFLLIRVYWCVQKLPNEGHAVYTSCLTSHYIAVRSFNTAVFLNTVFPDTANGADTVEAESHQSELLSWGQEQSGTHRETIFCSGTVRNHGKNLSVQSCALGHAVEVSVLGASGRPEGAGAAPKSALQAGFLTHFTAMAYVHCTVSSASKVKLQI